MENQRKNLLEVARRTIEIEAKALRDLAASLDDTSDFAACTEAIFQSKGRLVLTGIGKSALVAQKIVATLNSTGQPALFMHAADAIHGDLGMIQENDLVLCLSKSGETPEIRAVAPLLKSRGNQLIAMTANRESSLAKISDFTLFTPIEKEADPNNLAPTTSTTSQMALGDALAIALLSLRGFSPEDFAKFHPGGSLGKQMYLRVRDFYKLNERPVVSVSAGLREIIMEISSKRLGVAAVLDDSEKLTGIVTDGDLRRMLERNPNFSTVRADEISTKNPKTIHPDCMATDALETLRKHSISQLLVVENENYLGVLHLHDLIREGIF